MAISLDTSRRPATRRPSISTITRSEGFIMPLHMEVGVARMWRIVKTHRKIAIHRSHIAALVQGPAKEDNFAAMLAFARHGLRG